jgi:hypothetical protein
MREELFHLWNNYEVFMFLKGYVWIKKREYDICECLSKDNRIVFIETNRCDWILDEDKKKPPR